MKRGGGRGDRIASRLAGGEVGVSLVRLSPSVSWTGDSRAPLSAPRVSDGPGARFLEFFEGNPKPARLGRRAMEVLYPHCAGLDVHKQTVVACARHMVTAPSHARLGRSGRRQR